MKTQVTRCLSTWHSAGVQETENPDSIDIAPLWGGEKGGKTCLYVYNSLDINLSNETINPKILQILILTIKTARLENLASGADGLFVVEVKLLHR